MMDSAAGMGFGTCLAPLLFLLGYTPLQVVPAILISEAITGLINSFFNHEYKNVHFSFHPLNNTTRLTFIITLFGCIAIFASVFLSYYALKFPDVIIKTYVSILVLFMGVLGLIRLKLNNINKKISNPNNLIFFAVLAGFNKGIGGGGYGPVVTMGQVFSGVYEKSATAIVSLAEALVSIIGILTFILISLAGVEIDLVLLPSIFTGGFFAALLSPYLVRVLPNKIWKIILPIYALIIGIFSLVKIFTL